MTITTTVRIKATPQEVWSILLDFEKYPQWNPFITAISGVPEKGNRLKIEISTMRFRPIVLGYEKESELRWLGHLWFKGLFDGEHIFRIKAISSEEVVFEQKENFNGFLVPFFKKKLLRDTKAGFEAMNQALKQRCEK